MKRKKKGSEGHRKPGHSRATNEALHGRQVLLNPKITSRTRHRYRAVVTGASGATHSILLHGATKVSALAYGHHLAGKGGHVRIDHLADNNHWNVIGETKHATKSRHRG